jgi:tRNA-dihydrouridine synthase C
MRALQGVMGNFTYVVTEFVRVSGEALPKKVFRKEIPELANECRTPSGMPVQVQILGGDPERMAQSAFAACEAGAMGIDINFGCPAPTVNRHDGGASLLRTPCRIREIVSRIRVSVPAHIPVSAKLRLGWDSIDAIDETAAMAAEGGATWITIHARTRVQGYLPPVYWPSIGRVREKLGLPVVANGDIWTIEDFRRCQEETGCRHFMIGRSALASPGLPHQIARELGLPTGQLETDWVRLMELFVYWTEYYGHRPSSYTVARMKQWLKLAKLYGEFKEFDLMKKATSVEEVMDVLRAHRQASLTTV